MKRSKKEPWSRQSFLCRDNHKTDSVELCHDIFKICHNIILEKGIEHCRDITLQATTKMEDKQNNVVAKMSFRLILGIHNFSLEVRPIT